MDALGAREAYLYGYYGIPDGLMTGQPYYYTNLSDADQQAIYDIGRQARDAQIEQQWQRAKGKMDAAVQMRAEEDADFEADAAQLQMDADAGFEVAAAIEPAAENLGAVGEVATPEAEISLSESDLAVEESAEYGIIGYEELYRKAPDNRKGFKFISKERFDSLTVEARKNGATIVRGTPEVEKHLINMGASASHLGGALLFMRDVCVSEVLEETYHHMQNLRGLNDDKEGTLRTILNEIDAKQYLLDNAQKYKIPRNETELTRKQLEGYKKQLEEYGRK